MELENHKKKHVTVEAKKNGQKRMAKKKPKRMAKKEGPQRIFSFVFPRAEYSACGSEIQVSRIELKQKNMGQRCC